MPHTELTDLYLKEAAGRGMAPGDLLEVANREIDLGATTYFGRCMTRPVFLGRAEHAQLAADLENLFRALTALPDRLFGGDFGAFARAVGLTEDQVAAVLRSRSPAPVRMGRADLYPEPSGFRLMEINMGSTTGGGDNAMLNRAMLAHPALAEFAETLPEEERETVRDELLHATLMLTTVYDPTDGTGRLPGLDAYGRLPLEHLDRFNDHVRNMAGATPRAVLADVHRHFLVAEEGHVAVTAPAGHRRERLRVREHLCKRHLGLDRRHPGRRLHPVQTAAP